MNIQPVSYLQTDKRWSGNSWKGMTIYTAGCGPTCAAMLVTTLTGKEVTPAETYAWAGANGHLVAGHGTDYNSYFQKQFAVYGIDCKMMNWQKSYGDPSHENHQKMVEAIQDGYYVIALMNKGLWTSNGHFVVVWWAGDKIEINDPASTKSERLHGDPTTFFSQAKYYWLIDARAFNGNGGESMEYSAVLPLDKVEKVSIVFGNGRTLAKVKSDTGADYVMNGGFYNGSNKPVFDLKVDGVVKAGDGYTRWGYAWNDGYDMEMLQIPTNAGSKKNYITAISLFTPWDSKDKALSYAAEVGGTRGRTGIGIGNKSLILYCSKDGSSHAKTPEQLRTAMVSLGAENAVMLDGGGSSQCDFNGNKITSSRCVNNYICVWVKKSWTHKVSVGGSSLNIRSGPGSAYSKVGSYVDGAAVTVTEQRNGWGHTDKGWVSMAYLVEIPQETTTPEPEPIVTEPVVTQPTVKTDIDWAAENGLDTSDPSGTVSKAEMWAAMRKLKGE